MEQYLYLKFQTLKHNDNPKEYGRIIDVSGKIKKVIDVMEKHIYDPDLDDDPLW